MGASDLIGRLALAGVRLSVLGPDKLAAEPRDPLGRICRVARAARLRERDPGRR